MGSSEEQFKPIDPEALVLEARMESMMDRALGKVPQTDKIKQIHNAFQACIGEVVQRTLEIERQINAGVLVEIPPVSDEIISFRYDMFIKLDNSEEYIRQQIQALTAYWENPPNETDIYFIAIKIKKEIETREAKRLPFRNSVEDILNDFLGDGDIAGYSCSEMDILAYIEERLMYFVEHPEDSELQESIKLTKGLLLRMDYWKKEKKG